MYEFLLKAHSGLRHLVLLGLVVVVVKSLIGMLNKQPYSSLDNKLGLFTFIFTHTQLLLGLLLFFVSPFVKFGGNTSDETTYWTFGHSVGMLAAVVLITLARTTSKRMTNDADKHKRMFIFNFVALVVIIAVIAISGRKIL
ncbi:MAG TPA: cytochrome B [Chryseolinea sp.]